MNAHNEGTDYKPLLIASKICSAIMVISSWFWIVNTGLLNCSIFKKSLFQQRTSHFIQKGIDELLFSDDAHHQNHLFQMQVNRR
ncbi:MAG TPA: hypothetical protein DCF44_05435 [Chitinophagaceae bacterium]|nr:hypothetical protein [Chitinophagaceae bacterium]